MSIRFYPSVDDSNKGTAEDRIEVLASAALEYKALVLDAGVRASELLDAEGLTPRDFTAAFNWEELTGVLHFIREMPEANESEKSRKASLLTNLAEVYETLRSAKMPKLEAVRLALASEAKQLGGGDDHSSRVA